MLLMLEGRKKVRKKEKEEGRKQGMQVKCDE